MINTLIHNFDDWDISHFKHTYSFHLGDIEEYIEFIFIAKPTDLSPTLALDSLIYLDHCIYVYVKTLLSGNMEYLIVFSFGRSTVRRYNFSTFEKLKKFLSIIILIN